MYTWVLGSSNTLLLLWKVEPSYDFVIIIIVLINLFYFIFSKIINFTTYIKCFMFVAFVRNLSIYIIEYLYYDHQY